MWPNGMWVPVPTSCWFCLIHALNACVRLVAGLCFFLSFFLFFFFSSHDLAWSLHNLHLSMLEYDGKCCILQMSSRFLRMHVNMFSYEPCVTGAPWCGSVIDLANLTCLWTCTFCISWWTFFILIILPTLPFIWWKYLTIASGAIENILLASMGSKTIWQWGKSFLIWDKKS